MSARANIYMQICGARSKYGESTESMSEPRVESTGDETIVRRRRRRNGTGAQTGTKQKTKREMKQDTKQDRRSNRKQNRRPNERRNRRRNGRRNRKEDQIGRRTKGGKHTLGAGMVKFEYI